MEEEKRLEIQSVIGFSGSVPSGLVLHPDGKHMLYPLGSTIVVREIGSVNAVGFLQGHSDSVTCLAISPSGRYVASGQQIHMGFQADVIIWDFESLSLLHRLTLHKVKVETLAFSFDEEYLATVGGVDDNQLVVWTVEEGRALCGCAIGKETHCVSFFHGKSNRLVTGGKLNVRVWEMDLQDRKLSWDAAALGKYKRTTRCLCVSPDDSVVYCGTDSGDVMAVSLVGPKNLRSYGPRERFVQGVRVIRNVGSSGDIVIGGGDGTMGLLNGNSITVKKKATVMGGAQSVVVHRDEDKLFVGTTKGTIHSVTLPEMEVSIRQTCHYERINDLCFPYRYSDLFATCSLNDIRLWNVETSEELLRISVPNLECNCVCFSRDGKELMSGWSDGKIRCFGPQSGKLNWVIHDAHIIGSQRTTGSLVGVTALAPSASSNRLLSGGSDGQVRVWKLNPSSRVMEASMKEHKGTVNSLVVSENDDECVSACDDGSCIVWDLNRFARANIMYAQTYFKGVAYLPDESQLITIGTDRKVTYWDSADCSAIREVEGSTAGELLCVDVSTDGLQLVSGGQDRLVRVWDYDEGVVTSVGVGHSGAVTKAKFSPDKCFVVSVGSEGGIFLWKLE